MVPNPHPLRRKQKERGINMGASREVKGLEEQVEYGQSGTRNIQVSHEALLDLIEIEPSLAVMEGVPNIEACLKTLGFRIEGHKTSAGVQKWTGWSRMEDCYMRCRHDKTKAFKTTIYGGMMQKDYPNKNLYDDEGNYSGSIEREKANENLVDINTFNDHYRGVGNSDKVSEKVYGDVEHTLHCDIGEG